MSRIGAITNVLSSAITTLDTTNDWHTEPAEEVLSTLDSSPATGLSKAEAEERFQEYGANQLAPEEDESVWSEFAEEFVEELQEPLILLLVGTGVLYFFLGEVETAVVVFFVILGLNTIEVVNEWRAERAISALQEMAEPVATVLRDGEPTDIETEKIVPGDLLLLESGRRVPTDARLLEGFGLSVDESALTGESVPVDKDPQPSLAEETPLAERSNMVYSGTLVTRGRGKAVVVGTGAETELGRVADLSKQVEQPRTPLQQAMDEVSKTLLVVALAFSVIIPVLGVVITGQPLQEMLLTALSLAFATIPEELPIIITMVLGLGAYRLAKQHAIARNLRAVETLGSVTVIASDKTGTLTENQMQVSEVVPSENRGRILTAGALASDAEIGSAASEDIYGDPMEVALVRAAQADGQDVGSIRSADGQVGEFSFDNERKRMSTVFRSETGFRTWVKGAPESILDVSTVEWHEDGSTELTAERREEILDTATSMAERGLRVLAFAQRESGERPTTQDSAESNLTFLGLAGLADPARDEVPEALRSTDDAGIRTVMITGDHPATATAIAEQVGLDATRVVTGTELDSMGDDALQELVGEVSIFARTTPEQKFRLVRALRERGERVAVTGDGVNDAPALSAADIGVAMGETGSDVAREVGDIVLADDNFTTIANAVREGRRLFANLRKGVRYYLSIKVALVTVMLLPILLLIQVPFVPVQIILMELFMDLAAAATFVVEPPESDLMQQPPRDPDQPFMDRAMVSSIFVSAVSLAAAVSVVYLTVYYQGSGLGHARTAAFAAWMLGHVLLAFNMRTERQPVSTVGLFSNRLVLAWGAVSALFLLAVVYVRPLQSVLQTVPLGGWDWMLILIAVVIGTFWMEAYKLLAHYRTG